MATCAVKLKTDERLGVLIQCKRPVAGRARITCPRMGHVEIADMCNRCLYAITYCEQCLAEDQQLIRCTVLVMA